MSEPVDLSRDDDEPSDNPTVPPPPGSGDAYSAATVVKLAPPEILATLKQESSTLAQSVAEHNARAQAALAEKATPPPALEEAETVADIPAPSLPKNTDEGKVADLSSSEDDEPRAAGTVIMPETVVRKAREEVATLAADKNDLDAMRPGKSWTWVILMVLAIASILAWSLLHKA